MPFHRILQVIFCIIAGRLADEDEVVNQKGGICIEKIIEIGNFLSLAVNEGSWVAKEVAICILEIVKN